MGASMAIELSDEMRSLVDSILGNSGLESTEQVMLSALKHFARLFEDDQDCEIEGIPPAPIISRGELDAAIREGLESPSRVMTKKDFDEMRQQLIETYGAERVRQALELNVTTVDSAPHSGQRSGEARRS
jgi:hypothetical protein